MAIAQQLTIYLFISLILSLGYGQLLRFDFLGMPLYLHDVLIIIILVTQVTNLVKNYKVRNFVIPVGLKFFLAGLALGWIFALLHYPLTQLLIPSLYFLRLLAYLAMYLVIKTQRVQIPRPVFIISGLVSLAIGTLQYFLFPDMRIFQYLGWDDHLSRLTLPHFDPTFTAVMLALFLLSTNKVKFIFDILILLFTLVGILLTYSRSVWLSLILTGLMFIKNKSILLLAFSFMLFAIIMLPKRFGEGTNLLRTYSIASRFDSDIAYIQKYKWDLLLGRGMNTLILNTAPSRYENHATGPNNSYLYLLATTGILGLVGWGMFMHSLYVKSTHKPMFILFFTASLFNNVMFYPFALLWVLLVEVMAPTSA